MRPRMIPAGLAGVVGLAGVLATGACSDDEGPGAFCQGVREVDEEFESLDDDPEAVAGELAGLDPPEEIAGDWETFVEGLPEFVEPEAPQGEGDLGEAEEFSQRVEEYQAAVRNVRTYLSDECQLDV